LTSDLLQPVGAADHILLYRPRVATVKVLQTDRFRATNSRPLMITLPSAERQLPVRLEDNKSDYSRISVSDSAEDTLLFVSQQYFPTWRAFSGKRPLMVGLVNDFYQGIIVPPHTSEVELFHYPFAWWSWLPQAVFALLGILFVGRSVFHRVTARRPIEPEDIVIPGTRQLNPR